MTQCFFVHFGGGRGDVSPEVVVSPNDANNATSQPDLSWVAKLGPLLMKQD